MSVPHPLLERDAFAVSRDLPARLASFTYVDNDRGNESRSLWLITTVPVRQCKFQ